MSLQIKLSDYYIAYFDILGYRGLFSGNEGQNCEIIENIITAFNKISNSINQNNSSPILEFEIKYADIIDYRYGTFLIMLVDNNTGNERSDKTTEK